MKKIAAARALIDEIGLPIRLQIDGGVTANNIGEIAAAGADTFVAGSAIFKQADYSVAIEQLKAPLLSTTRGA